MAQKPVKILQASAGSGKTFSLAVHYLTLLFSDDNKYREILAVTFTNKATAEMKERILEVLEGLATGDESNKVDSYRKRILSAHPLLDNEGLKQKADRIYRKILHDYSRFAVSTIDGFVQKVIRGFAFELGFDTGYALEMNIDKVKQSLTQQLDDLLDENDGLLQWMVDLALDKIANNKNWNYKSELLGLVGEIFNEKFECFEEALKRFGLENTAEVFKKYIDFSKSFVKQFETDLIALATQAQQAVSQSGQTSADFKGKSRSNLLKFGNIVYRDFSAVEKVLGLLDNEEEWMGKGRPNTLFAMVNPLLQQMASVYHNGVGQYILAVAFVKNAYFLRLMLELASLMAKYREESESLLISDAQKLLDGITKDAGNNPSFIWEKMGGRYRNFLFDEFQDTSASQWNSFVELVKNAVSGYNGQQQDHLIVGDAKQSIYRWRNGDYKLLHYQAKANLGAHNVEEAKLEENYRSTQEIIGFNNNLYLKLPQLLQQKINSEVPAADENIQALWHKPENSYHNIIADIYQSAGQSTHAGTLPNGLVNIKKVVFEKSEETPAEPNAPQNAEEAMLEAMLTELKTLIDQHSYQPKEIGVLVRTNTEAAKVVAALMAAGLNVISGEALAIANNTAIKLLINVLRLLLATPENSALYKANIIALYAQLHQKPVQADAYLNLKATPTANLTSALPADFCGNWQSWAKLPMQELVEKIIKSFGLDQLKREGVNPYLPYLLAFRDLCAGASKQGEKGIYAFLNWWNTEGVKKSLPSPETANAIQVSTIAKSKGLAYRAVFIPFCNWSLGGKPNATFWAPTEGTPYADLANIPLAYTSALKASSIAKYYLEELLFNHMDALNNLYVATTRAKDYLYIGLLGKKKASLINIGDAILAVFAAEFAHSDDIHIGRLSTIGEKVAPVNALTLDGYPSTNRLDEIYLAESQDLLPQRYIDNIVQSGERGTNLHQILAKISSVDEIEEAINEVWQLGLIKQEDKTVYTDQLTAVLTHPELMAILTGQGIQINEKSIIDANGRLKRIDKLILNGDKATIIDYKFTINESSSHIAQIAEYKNLVSQLGYKEVKAYLFYSKLNKLKEV